MADLPISFSKPMVQALLAGRKTQTRREHPPEPRFEPTGCNPAGLEDRTRWWDYWAMDRSETHRFKLPYAVGDRLYVREHWRIETTAYDCFPPREIPPGQPLLYEADAEWGVNKTTGRFRQAMHMPRWASRLTNIVTEVRVQRLQDITEEDAIAEGVEPLHTGYFPYGITTFLTTFVGDREVPAQCCRTAKHSYEMLWNSLHGPGAWEANPWVAAYSFTVQRGNIDTQGDPQ